MRLIANAAALKPPITYNSQIFSCQQRENQIKPQQQQQQQPLLFLHHRSTWERHLEANYCFDG